MKILNVDLVVVGGGVAGAVAAIAAARLGMKTVLFHNRPVLGGPSSSECCVNSDGSCVNGAAEYVNRNARETGIIEELKLEAKYRSAVGWSQHWSLVLREWAERESDLQLFLNTEVFEVEMSGNRIIGVSARTIGSETMLKVFAPQFIDCSGDSFLGFAAGAEYRIGREARGEFGESMAQEVADSKTMGSSIAFRAMDIGHPIPFKAPEWAVKFPSDESLPFRHHDNPRSGYWWLEYGGELDTIADNEKIYRKLLSILYGVWDHVKNGGDHGADNYVINWISAIPGKRESRRLMGDYILTQKDVTQHPDFADTVAYGGWPIDLHPPEGVFSSSHPGSTPPFTFPGVYPIPFRCLYSKNIDNLMMAGRNISVTHVALGTTRVMATCALCGQAAGTAAFLTRKYQVPPREVGMKHIAELQELLASNDIALPLNKNKIPGNIAFCAEVVASSTMRLKTGDAVRALPLIAASSKDEIFDPCNVPPEDRRRAQMFPVSSDRIDRITVYMNSDNPAPVQVTAMLRSAGKANDFSSNVDIASSAAVVRPGQNVPVVFEFNQPVVPGRLYWIVLSPVEKVSVCISDRYLPGLYLKADGCYFDNGNFCFDIEPAQQVFGPENAVNGRLRADDWPNMWISDPDQPLPQQLTLKFSAAQTFNHVEITFDTNLNKLMSSGAAPECVREYELEVLVDGNWRSIAKVNGNYFRRRIHCFPAVTASQARVTVSATNGDQSARIYEVRVFNNAF